MKLKTRLGYALFYRDKMNLSVIPIRRENKKPAVPWKKYQKIKATRSELKEWFGKGSEYNVGIVTGMISGIAVVDLDSKEAIEYAKQKNYFQQTPKVKTGRGYHLYYAYKEGCRNQANIKGIKIDIRGEGGYVLAPPSIHESGKQYKWLDKKLLDDFNIIGLPDEFLDTQQKNTTDLKELYKGVPKGQRNDSLARLVGSWVNDGLSYDECLTNAHLVNSKNKPTMKDREVERVVKSIFALHEQTERAKDDYFLDNEEYLCRNKWQKTRYVTERLANFEAFIKEEIVEDDGIEKNCKYIIEGKSKNHKLKQLVVPALSFPSMNFVANWGNRAIIEPGFSKKDHMRHAIQVRSNPIRKTCFTHTGWTEINGEKVYLSASGGIGKKNVMIKLPQELESYILPSRPENEKKAIETSLYFLEIANKEVTLPLLMILYLSPLTTVLEPMPNFSGYLYGETGVHKTTLAMQLLSHFGRFDSIKNLSNFEDTANMLGKRAFTLKDTLMVIDDYHPSPRKYEAQQKESVAQRLIRSFSNRTDRGRLNPDATEKGRFEPRGMLLITGEEIISLQSTLARTLVIEVCRDDINLTRLSKHQRLNKLLPNAMSSYIRWLRKNYVEIQKKFSYKFPKLREIAQKEGRHKKLSEQVAFLQFALIIVLNWAKEKGVINVKKAKSLRKEGWRIFNQLSNKQAKHIEGEDPVKIFMDIFVTLLAQEKVRIESKDISKGIHEHNGELIGYKDADYIYLIPTAAWNLVQKYCISEGSHFPVKKKTFYRMLKENKLIVTEKTNNTIAVKIQGKTQKVLKLIRNNISKYGVT